MGHEPSIYNVIAPGPSMIFCATCDLVTVIYDM